MIAINTKPSFFAVRRAAHHMRQNGGGSIVLLGSIDGVKTMPSPVHYAASKGALAAMVKAMAKELGPDNIRVTASLRASSSAASRRPSPTICATSTSSTAGSNASGASKRSRVSSTWLATENTFVSGQTVVVDGGL